MYLAEETGETSLAPGAENELSGIVAVAIKGRGELGHFRHVARGLRSG